MTITMNFTPIPVVLCIILGSAATALAERPRVGPNAPVYAAWFASWSIAAPRM